MKTLIIDIKRKEEVSILDWEIYTLDVTAEMLKEFQKTVINWLPDDTNVFFNLEQ